MTTTAIIYARCSTDESKQDVEVQLKELRAYCIKEGWKYNEVSEYSSGSKVVPEKLRDVLRLIREGHYDIMLVYSLDRFSRLHPSSTNKIMDFIVQECKCRFISLQEKIDSDNEIMWYVIRHLFHYFAWTYSKNLSEKVRLGMERAREKGSRIGRPAGVKDKKPRSKKGYYLKAKKNPLKF